jgi:hypothetical protein
MDKKCAPGKKYKEGSCFTVNNLLSMAILINKKHPEEYIELKEDKKYLLKKINKFMKGYYDCNDQVCWLKTDLLEILDNNDINFFTFRPDGPEGKTGWLSTSDINNVMNQYEKKYNDFKFFGAVPYDFEDLKFLKVSKINFKDLGKTGKNQLGMVVNLDKHNMKGSHWVAIYVNLEKEQIYFFDSFANQPGDLVKKFLGKCLKYMYKKRFNTDLTKNDLDEYNMNLDKFDVRYNSIRHQFKNSECGVYSMNFILRLLNGEDFDSITTNITKDDQMNECREIYFKN